MSLTSWSFSGICLTVCLSSASGAQQIPSPVPASQPPITPPGLKAAAPPPPVPAAEPAPAFDPALWPGYLLQPGDVLQIAVWKETELTAEVTIRPDGGMTFPLAGDLTAAGHTVAELTDLLEKRIRKFEPDAVLTVSIKAAAGNRVYVVGKVLKPGDFPLNRPTDVMQALSLAGGATPFANTNGIRILRRKDGKETAIRFRYADVQRGKKLEQNILLQSGDTVVVP